MSREQQAEVNKIAFASAEPLRLWAKEHAVRAPFSKLVVELGDPETARGMNGANPVLHSICHVILGVELVAVQERISDLRWTMGMIQAALDRVVGDAAINWASPSLGERVSELASQSWPVRHYFERRKRVVRRGGAVCVPWFETRPLLTRIGVRIDNHDVELMVEDRPIYLEDTFPMARTRIDGQDFVILAKDGRTLARVPLAEH